MGVASVKTRNAFHSPLEDAEVPFNGVGVDGWTVLAIADVLFLRVINAVVTGKGRKSLL
jgi:hypothetical protein